VTGGLGPYGGHCMPEDPGGYVSIRQQVSAREATLRKMVRRVRVAGTLSGVRSRRRLTSDDGWPERWATVD